MVQNITGNMLCEIEQFIWPSTWWPLFIDSTHDLPYTAIERLHSNFVPRTEKGTQIKFEFL